MSSTLKPEWPRRIALMLELHWPLRRHLEVYAGTQRYAQEQGRWRTEINEFAQGGIVGGARRRYDGVIARATAVMARAARRCRIPAVNVWFASPARQQMPGVFPDFAAIGRLAADHLIQRGFRRLATLSVARDPSNEMVCDGFRQVATRHGLPVSDAFIRQHHYRNTRSWLAHEQRIEAWVSAWKPPVGVFIAVPDFTARLVAHVCHRRGLRVPDDAAIISSTNEPAMDLLPPPSITAIETNHELVGYHAAQILDQMLDGHRPPMRPVWIQPTGVIARQSTDFFAVEDDLVVRAMRFIDANTAQRIEVEDVAKAVNVSRRTLERRFRAAMNRGVYAEIQRLRLTRAKRLLVETDLPVKEIAWHAGFGTSIRMNEVFTREEGMAPGRYRRQARVGG